MLFLLKLSRSFGVFPIVEIQGRYAVSIIWLIFSLFQLSAVLLGRVRQVDIALSTSKSPFQIILEIGHVITLVLIVISAFLNVIATPKYINRFSKTVDDSLKTLANSGFRKENKCSRNLFGWCLLLQVAANVVIKFFNDTQESILLACLDTFAVHYFLSGAVVIFTTFVIKLDDALGKLLTALLEVGVNRISSKKIGDYFVTLPIE